MKNWTTWITAMTIAAVAATTALAGSTPSQKCEAGKNGAVGKYVSCMHLAQKKFLNGGETNEDGISEALLACERKYSTKWRKAEIKGGADCPSTGDQGAVQTFVDACVAAVEDALGGEDLLSDVATCNGDLSSAVAGLATCSGNFGACNTSLTACGNDLSSANADLTTAGGGTAAIGDVLSGKTFTSTAGLGASGTMPNNGGVLLTPGTTDQAIAAGYHDGSGKCAGDAGLVAANIKSGVTLFGVAGTAPALAGQVHKTGQTLCYNASGTVIPCAGTGQDGEFVKGVAAASFTDNGDGTITDNRTGLMWEKLSDDGTIHDKDTTYNWTTAVTTKVATLNSTSFAGYDDWRLPNIKELESLKNFGAVSPATYSAFATGCSASCTVLTCSCTQLHNHWSSSTSQGTPNNAWDVNFFNGNSTANFKTDLLFVRAVRAGS